MVPPHRAVAFLVGELHHAQALVLKLVEGVGRCPVVASTLRVGVVTPHGVPGIPPCHGRRQSCREQRMQTGRVRGGRVLCRDGMVGPPPSGVAPCGAAHTQEPLLWIKRNRFVTFGTFC